MDDADVLNQLDAYLADEQYDVDEPVNVDEPLVIESEQHVQSMLRKRRRLVDERERVVRVAQGERDRITQFVDDRTHGIDNALVWLDRGLEQWTRRMNEHDRKRKSWAMPSGTLKLRAPGTHATVIDDRGAFMAWVSKVDERAVLLRTPEPEPDKSSIKSRLKLGPELLNADGLVSYAAVDEHGERVPGVVFTKPALDAFAVTHPVQDEATNPKER